MNKFFAVLLAVLLPVSAVAAFKTPAETRFLLNQGYGSTTQLGTQLVDKKEHVLKAVFDHAVAGVVSGSVNLKDVDGKDAVLPDNAIVTDCLIDVLTAPTTTLGTYDPQLRISTGQSSGDLKAAAGLASYSGLVACVPVGSAATSIKMTAQRTPTLTIVTASTSSAQWLTGGKIAVFIKYLLSE